MSFRFHPGTIPLLISIPHNGSKIPADVAAGLTDAGLESRDTDWFVDRLYDLPAAAGCSLIVAGISRFVIDLNRPASGESLYPGQTTTGLIPGECFDGTPIQLGPPPGVEETSRRVSHYWQPYHNQLAAELARLVTLHGRAVLLDAHSIRPLLPRLFRGRLPDLNVGTHRGLSCADSLAEAVVEPLRQQRQFSWVRDGRFVGGYITRHYGQPERNIHAFQVELAQSTYLHDGRAEWHPERAGVIQHVLASLLSAVRHWLQCD
jgi:N-formylglutamate deformylase